MKTLLLLSSVLVAAGASAKQAADHQQTLAAEAATRKEVQLTTAEPAKPNQIVGERFTFSGIAVQAVKARNPLHLLNPVASEEYGSGRANVVQEPTSERAIGLKIFSIEF
jgi:hypothetical protein